MSKQLKRKEITKREAETRTSQHKKDFAGLQKGWHLLGKEVAKSVDLGVPAKLGKTMRAWLDETFEQSSSHIFRQLQNLRALDGVPDKKLEQIPEGNAHQLTRLPEKIRKSAEVIEKATTQTPAEFRDTVNDIREKKFGIKQEAWQTFAVRLPLPVWELLQAAQEKIGRVLQVDLESDDVRTTSLITVWEAIAQLVNGTDEAWLKIELEGGGPLEEIQIRRGSTVNSPNSGTKSEPTLIPPATSTTMDGNTSPEKTSLSGASNAGSGTSGAA